MKLKQALTDTIHSFYDMDDFKYKTLEKLKCNLDRKHNVPQGKVESFLSRDSTELFQTEDVRLLSLFVKEALELSGRKDLIDEVFTEPQIKEIELYQYNAKRIELREGFTVLKYNEAFKEEFLATLEGTSLTPVYTSLFKKSKLVEERLGKDIYEFNIQDAELLFYSVSTASVKTLGVYLSLITRYVDYAIESGAHNSNFNIYKNIQTRELGKYVSYYKHQYLTLEEFNEFMSYIANEFDVAMFRALFEGIGGSGYSEIRNLKITDLRESNGKFYATLYDDEVKGTTKRTKEISYELYKDLHKANRQHEYISNNGEGISYNSTTEFVNSEYVFKPLKKGDYTQSEGQVNKQTVYRKKVMLDELTDGKISSIKTLAVSGMIHQVYRIHQDKGEVTEEDLLSVGELYKSGSNSQFITQRVKRMKEVLAKGLRDRYDIEL